MSIKTPKSYFFTESTGFSQSPPQAFGPMPDSPERKFNLTNLFTRTAAELKAFAVTDGILFIVPQKENDNLVNIILKPSKPVDIGVKIKYYVYRSIKREQLFAADGSSFKLLPNNTSGIIPFLNGIWNEFLEYNPGTNSNTIFEASKIGFNTNQLNDYKAFFNNEGKYTLPKIKMGDHIGNFDSEFGFEVVVDEGDFSQNKSDTGFEFKDDFFRAKSCILNLDGGNSTKEYGNLPNSVSEKVFRESVYLFLDPAPYYGSHITDLNNNNQNGGNISLKESNIEKNIKSISDIYNKIVKLFINRNKTYLYIKSFRGRSYNYYTNSTTPITITQHGTNPNAFNEKLWPLRIFEMITPLRLRLNIFNKDCLLFCNSENSESLFYNGNQLLSTDGTTASEISFFLPKTTSSDKVSSIVYLTYNSGKENFYQNLFGPLNLNSLFEKEDFTINEKISWVNHLKPTLTFKGRNIGVFNTKMIIDSTFNENEKILHTFRISMIRDNMEGIKDVNPNDNMSSNTGYLAKEITNSKEFCLNVLGIKDAEIWKGKIKDGTQSINSLVLRRDENLDAKPTYILGLTKKDYQDLENRITNISEATNIYLDIGNNLASDNDSLQFAKYAMQLTYDDKLGQKVTTTSSSQIYLYTIDGLFYFTKLYSENFNSKYYNEFAKISVDFRPGNDWMQYYKYKKELDKYSVLRVYPDGLYNNPNVFYGFDWLRKGDSEKDGVYRISEDSYDNFYNIIGVNLGTDPNDSAKVTLDKKLYINARELYRPIPVDWKLPDGPLFINESYTNNEPNDLYDKDYYPSWINIPHIEDNTIQSIKLRLKIRCKQTPGNLKLYFNANNFKINKIGNTNNPSVKQDKVYVNEGLSYVDVTSDNIPSNNTIKWIDFEFDNISVYNKLEMFKILDNNDNLAGKLYLPPNAAENIKYKKLLIVKVKHNTTLTGTGEVNADELKMLKIFSSHANIKLKIEEFNDTDNNNSPFLDLSGDTTFQNYFNSTGKVERDKLVQFKTVYKYLLSKIKKYDDYVKIFSINAGAVDYGVGGATIENMKVVIMFNSPMEGTSPNIYHLAHEYLHSIGVAHTFTDKLIDENAFLTFAKAKTNNVMDYDHDENLYPARQFVQGTFFWQWAIARQNSNKNF